jgi:hypothetical protein
MDLGSERVISVDPNQRNRVRYQLKRQDGEWKVLWRQRLGEAAGGGGAAAPGTAPGGGGTGPPAAADGGP